MSLRQVFTDRGLYRFSLNHICSFSYIIIITLDFTTILERKLHSFSLASEKLLFFNKRCVSLQCLGSIQSNHYIAKSI